MYPQPVLAPKLAFGPFEFDPAPGELHKHGHKIRLASQPCQILGALLERPGDLVTREDLRSRLWPGATAGDFEHGLNAAVNKLRQALGDSADQPLYVETLPTRGKPNTRATRCKVGAQIRGARRQEFYDHPDARTRRHLDLDGFAKP